MQNSFFTLGDDVLGCARHGQLGLGGQFDGGQPLYIIWSGGSESVKPLGGVGSSFWSTCGRRVPGFVGGDNQRVGRPILLRRLVPSFSISRSGVQETLQAGPYLAHVHVPFQVWHAITPHDGPGQTTETVPQQAPFRSARRSARWEIVQALFRYETVPHQRKKTLQAGAGGQQRQDAAASAVRLGHPRCRHVRVHSLDFFLVHVGHAPAGISTASQWYGAWPAGGAPVAGSSVVNSAR